MERKPPYSVTYYHDGAEYALIIPWAASWEDAERRIKSIGFTGRVDGSNVSQVKVNSVTLPFIGLWATILCWLQNRRRAK